MNSSVLNLDSPLPRKPLRWLEAAALVAAFVLVSDARAQICCPAGCVQDGNACVRTGPNPVRCATVPCPGGGGGGAGGGGGGGHGGLVPWVPFPATCFVDQPPRGSYQRSCTGIKWDCKTLSATCRKRDGGQVATSISADTRCIDEIQNMDGHLHCSTARLPEGSYKNSCRDMWADSVSLHAQCKNRNGDWVQSPDLAYALCRNGVDNIDHTLKCH